MANQSTIVALGLALICAGCLEDESSGPSGGDVLAERTRLQADVAREKKRNRAPADEAEAPSSFAFSAPQYRYEAAGRRDPFEPYRAVEPVADEPGGGPLEQFELEQLAVVALIWAGPVAKAMVSDPSGTTYTVGLGSRMGKNEGRVIHIGDNLVLVKETYVDYSGDESTKDVQLMIRSSQGG